MSELTLFLDPLMKALRYYRFTNYLQKQLSLRNGQQTTKVKENRRIHRLEEQAFVEIDRPFLSITNETKTL
jgi:hypothetical protein